jgi:spore coat polysaccharide biosynthesis predicted glycosyltransferase SpsG
MFGICVEASHQRGMGHLFRVLNLCEELRNRNIPFMIFTNHEDSSMSILEQRGLPFEVVTLGPENNDWQQSLIRKHGIALWIDDRLDTVLDHAGQVKSCGIPLVTFDDRGSGANLADLNVAALSFDEAESLQGERVLRGPGYLVLNQEIAGYKRLRTTQNSIVVSMGGSDTYGVTIKVIKLLQSAGQVATVIIGPAFLHEKELEDVLSAGFLLKRSVPSLVEEFSHHDLAITGGGITPFEANAAGLPCVIIANEDFEIPVGMGIAKLGGAVFAGHHSAIQASVLSETLPIEAMSTLALQKIDLCGVARVVDEIENLV